MPRSMSFWPLLALLAVTPLRAESSDRPHYLVQIQPAGRLLKTVKEFSRKYATPQLGDQAAEKTGAEIDRQLDGVLGKGWREAIDESEPIFLYGRVAETVAKNLAILLLPVKSERAAREHLQRMGAKLEESAKGCQKCILPGMNQPIYLRFSGGYLYTSFLEDKSLAEERLPAPAKLLDPKEKAAVAIRLYFDRVPKAVKDKIVTALDEVARKGLQDYEEEPAKRVQRANQRGWKAVVQNGKELALQLDLDAATGELKAFLQLTPQEGSDLAALLAGLRRGSSLGAALVAGEPLGAVHARLSLSQEIGDFLLTQGRQSVKESLKKVEDDKERQALLGVAESLEPTIKEGILDTALVLHGPGQKKRYGAVLALQLKDGLAVEKALKKLIGFLPAKNPLRFLAMETDTVAGVKVHRYPLGEMVPEPVQNLFGKTPAVIAFRKEGVLVAYGDKAEEHLGRALAVELGKAPPLAIRADGDAKRLADLIARSDPKAGAAEGERIKKFADLFEGRLRLFEFSLSGGQTLQVRASINLILLPRAAAPKAGRTKDSLASPPRQ